MSLAETTIVTAFYPLKKSKYGVGKYRAWIQNFCKIPAHMVIFTTETYMLEIYQWRKEFLDKTAVIVRPFDSFAMTCPAMMRFWEKQWTLDPEKEIHGPELYAVWAMKQELVRIAIHQNRFQSKWFVWCDIGIQRYSALQDFYMTFPSEVPRLCDPGRLAFLEIASIPDSYVANWSEGKPMEYPLPKAALGGGCIAGDEAAWLEFGEAYKEMLKEFALRGWFAGKDQEIFFAILMEKKATTFKLFHAKTFGPPGQTIIPGIDWMCFPVMLGGILDAPLDMRFESTEDGK
jgi:hypothetical protein